MNQNFEPLYLKISVFDSCLKFLIVVIAIVCFLSTCALFYVISGAEETRQEDVQINNRLDQNIQSENIKKAQELFSYVQSNITNGVVLNSPNPAIITNIKLNHEVIIEYNYSRKMLVVNYRGQRQLIELDSERNNMLQMSIDDLIFNQAKELI